MWKHHSHFYDIFVLFLLGILFLSIRSLPVFLLLWLLCFNFLKNDSLFGHFEIISVVCFWWFVGHIQKISNLVIFLFDFAWLSTMRDILDFLFDFSLEESTIIVLGNHAQELRVGMRAGELWSGSYMWILQVDVAELMFAVFEDGAVFWWTDVKFFEICVNAAKGWTGLWGNIHWNCVILLDLACLGLHHFKFAVSYFSWKKVTVGVIITLKTDVKLIVTLVMCICCISASLCSKTLIEFLSLVQLLSDFIHLFSSCVWRPLTRHLGMSHMWAESIGKHLVISFVGYIFVLIGKRPLMVVLMRLSVGIILIVMIFLSIIWLFLIFLIFFFLETLIISTATPIPIAAFMSGSVRDQSFNFPLLHSLFLHHVFVTRIHHSHHSLVFFHCLHHSFHVFIAQ